VENIIDRDLEDEMKESYLNYAMSVIISRALPDVRDGLKPIHRRILYAMNSLGLTSDKPYKKSATIVGEVLGKYHPHGDMAVYNTMVRLAQDFSLRYMLVDGQGNFGSIDGDPPAAMRYTEARLSKISKDMLTDIKKETVDFRPNFDESLKEPVVLPNSFPNLLANGSTGIAVGMATNIPPHNLNEIYNATIAYIDNNDITLKELMKHIPGPDFPTGGIIHGRDGIESAYKTGRGKIKIRSKFDIEDIKNGREAIIIKEIPYQLNKTNLLVKIADQVKNKKIEGISALRDESDRNGMRIVIELKKNTNVKIVLNQLFKNTQMQSVFGINMLALVDGTPKVLGLKSILKYFVKHRFEVIERRTRFDLNKAEKRLHILEGLLLALADIDKIIKIIKSSKNVDAARTNLMNEFKTSQIQAQSILDMKLQKLVNLERIKIEQEHQELKDIVNDLKDILANESRVYTIIKEGLKENLDKFGDVRATEIEDGELDTLEVEDLITKEDMVITISNKGLIKRTPIDSYKKQKRGGAGVTSGVKKDADVIESLFVASTHHYIIFVSNKGKAYYLKVHELPLGNKNARGKSVKSLLNLATGEELKSYVPVNEFNDNLFLVLATSSGVIKKTQITQLTNAKTRGIYAITLDKGDNVVSAELTDGSCNIFLCTSKGNALVFPEDRVRSMGRAARGVRGIKLKVGDELSGMIVVREADMKKQKMLVITEKGYGKRVAFTNFNTHNRGTGGQKYVGISGSTGEVAAVRAVSEEDELFAISSMGMIIRTLVSGIPQQGRAARGVKVVNIKEPDMVVDIGCVRDEEE